MLKHFARPIDLALPLHRCRVGTFVLDGGGAIRPDHDRFAVLGGEPLLEFRAWRSDTHDEHGRRRARVTIDGLTKARGEVADPFAELEATLARVLPRGRSDVPLPFSTGAVGYVAYECGQMLERLPAPARPSLGLPDIVFIVPRWTIGTCRTTGRSFLSVLSETQAEADAVTSRVLRLLPKDNHEEAPVSSARPPRSLEALAALGAELGLRAALSRDAYLRNVDLAKRHIERGDAFEICLTNALHAPFAGDPRALFDDLRRTSPAPHAAYLALPEASIVSSSPERFLSLTGKIAESRPIKGTRPRGTTEEEDRAYATALATSEKDRAENTMIVDLVRNDLGRVSRIGSVSVPQMHVVEPYATVHQMVSTIRSELADGRSAFDLLRAAFPPGSMTGAPKIEAVRILEHLEPEERGIYAGALGWIDTSGDMDLSVVIRTVVVTPGRATFSVGGAVVADSDPAAEHDESMYKARALIEALARCRRSTSSVDDALGLPGVSTEAGVPLAL